MRNNRSAGVNPGGTRAGLVNGSLMSRLLAIHVSIARQNQTAGSPSCASGIPPLVAEPHRPLSKTGGAVENPVNCPQRTPLEAFKARKNVASRSHPRILL
jgi:hypothetical protein